MTIKSNRDDVAITMIKDLNQKKLDPSLRGKAPQKHAFKILLMH